MTPASSKSGGILLPPNHRIFIVVPAYNEGAILRQTIARLVPYGYTIVVVDDGSAIPQDTYIGTQPVHYLRHVINLGQGAALQTGTAYAAANGAQIIVHFDADGQHNPAQIRKLVEAVSTGTCDVALGSRFLEAADRQHVPLRKQILLKAGVFVSWLFTGIWLTDTHNGFRALSRTAAQQIKLTDNGFAHATEILECIRKSDLRYKEIPATIEYTDYSQQKGQSVFNSINIVIDLVLHKVLR